MANIAQYLAKILSARYGKDVRQSIHDALDAVNTSAEGSAKSAEESAEKAEAVAKDLENVKLHAEATTELMGAVKYDGTTIKKNDSGQLTVGEIEEKGIKFKLPVSLSNIVSGESLAVLFGKIHDYIESFISSFETHEDEIGLLQEKYSDLKSNKINYTDTVDDLISTSSDSPLSANMGRELAERIDAVNTDLTNAVNYKHLGYARYGSPLAFPATWNEMVVYATNGYYISTINILKGAQTLHYLAGIDSNHVRFTISNNTFTIESSTLDGKSNTDATTGFTPSLSVYFR